MQTRWPAKSPKPRAAEVVFGVADQQDIMRFEGLRPNDPQKER